MNDYDFLAPRKRNRTLLIVEGEQEEVKLFELILKCFPEIEIDSESIIVFYGTNIYKLHQDIINEYGNDWADLDIDLPYLMTQKNRNGSLLLQKRDFTNIFLIFDYERQDPFFSEEAISNLQKYFSDETDQGKLYLNYPMIESYCDLNQIPDCDYENRKVSASMQSGNAYKKHTALLPVSTAVNYPKKLFHALETAYHITEKQLRKSCVDQFLRLQVSASLPEEIERILKDVLSPEDTQRAIRHFQHLIKDFDGLSYYQHTRKLLQDIVVHNIRKANKVQNNFYQVPAPDLCSCCNALDYSKILTIQNELSHCTDTGFIWVLSACVMFIPEYNSKLLEDD